VRVFPLVLDADDSEPDLFQSFSELVSIGEAFRRFENVVLAIEFQGAMGFADIVGDVCAH
jgi:hypothetical protein